jgi:hypothetical protein
MSQFMDSDEINRGYGGSSQESRESDDYLYSGLSGEKLRRDELGDDSQAQKISAQEELSPLSKALAILAIILSSLGFFLMVAGIVASAIVLKDAHGQQELLAAGVIGLVSSIVVLLICLTFWVIAVITLALQARRARRRTGRAGWRTRYR